MEGEAEGKLRVRTVLEDCVDSVELIHVQLSPVCLSVAAAGMALQHHVLSCRHLVLQRRATHLEAPKSLSLQRDSVHDREDPAASYQRDPDQYKLQTSYTGQLVPAEEDHDVVGLLMKNDKL